MAEESISLPLTPDLNKPAGPTSRRNSTGKVNRGSGGEVLSRYLRASTGSCHDFCKHGKKLAVEDEARNPMPKGLTAKPRAHRDSSQTINPRRDEAPLQKKTSALKHKSSLNSGSHATRPLKQGQLSKSLESLSTGKMRISLKDASQKDASPKVEEKSLSRKNAALLKFTFPTERKLSSSSSPSEGSNAKITSGTSESRNRKVAVTSKVASRKISPSPTASLSSTPPVNQSVSLPLGKYCSLNLVKIPNETENVEERSNNGLKERSIDELQAKTLYVVMMKKETKIRESYENENGAVELFSPQSPFKSDIDEDSAVELLPTQPLYLKSDDIKAEEGNTNLKPEEIESCMVGSSALTSSSHESSSVPATPSLSYPSEGAEDEQESEYNTESEVEHDFLSECNETMNVEEEEEGMFLGEQKVADNDSQPQELHFRRGKVVDIQSDSRVPRRLKFRRGTVLGDNEDVKSKDRRSFRKREAVSDTNVDEPNEEKVVLRHQDMQGKKDAQVLLNNVIEETASKLVESRKSKVKALVGAFETVILLQENNPCSDIATTNEQVS